MSDFDKEAEREKLREKFEQEEDKREATEQMSELLLKGATMTNAHCSTCGDPVFRYDGQEFCPTCQKPITRESGADDGAEDVEGDHIEVADTSDEARVQFGGDGADAEQSTESQLAEESAESQQPGDTHAPDASAEPDVDESAVGAPHETADDPVRQPTADTQTAAAQSGPTSGNQPRDHSPTVSTRTAGLPEDAATDLTEAKRALARTARQFAQRAADSQDPRDAREHLKAAREAAAALDATNF